MAIHNRHDFQAFSALRQADLSAAAFGHRKGRVDETFFFIQRAALAELGPRVNAGDLWGAVERRAAVVNEIRGGSSRYVSDEDARRLRALGSEVITLEGAGHFLHVDAPDELLAALLRLHGSE